MAGYEDIFARARREGRPALIPYVMAGDPDPETTVAVVLALAEAGADAVELGIPYTDPLADGPTIQAAGQRALAGGATFEGVLALFDRLRAVGGPPLIAFGYANPIERYGHARFAQRLAAAGALGAIVPDLPYEECAGLRGELRARGLGLTQLVAPTTSDERAARIAAASDGFLYVVSRMGVTGAGGIDPAPVIDQVRRLRRLTELPLAVGFGISKAEHVEAIGHVADGVIVGSALIDALGGRRGEAASNGARTFIASLKIASHKA
ncbi:tryptophan synthase subunit alpha [bacterium]|nr:MAG: tryptophan synthase subunit alpha [bacterium]